MQSSFKSWFEIFHYYFIKIPNFSFKGITSLDLFKLARSSLDEFELDAYVPKPFLRALFRLASSSISA